MYKSMSDLSEDTINAIREIVKPFDYEVTFHPEGSGSLYPITLTPNYEELVWVVWSEGRFIIELFDDRFPVEFAQDIQEQITKYASLARQLNSFLI